MKPKKVIPIGCTLLEVRMAHAKRSVLYFAKNFCGVDANLTFHQKEILRMIDRKDKDESKI